MESSDVVSTQKCSVSCQPCGVRIKFLNSSVAVRKEINATSVGANLS